MLRTRSEALTVRADVAEVDLVVDGVTGALTELTSMRALVDKLADLRQLADSVTRQLAGPRKSEARPADRSLESARSLSENLSRACRTLEGQLTTTLERANQELDAVRGHAEQLRLSPASTMFNALERAVRDAAHELAKPVSIETRGGEIRLDGSVLELVQSAFFHVVRNAVAHGIEPLAERVAANKPPQGMIRIEVRRAGRRVAFSCRDDGAGIDVEGVREALRRAGRSDADELSPQQVLDQLLYSGVSTTSRVTAISGRGVGLDVLREAAEQLSGTVRLDSERGRGLQIELVVPLSIAAVEALEVESAGRRVSLPLESITQSVRLQEADVARTASGQSVVHEGQVIPFLPLSRALRSEEQNGTLGRVTAVIVRSSAGSLALGVDRVVGTRTLVLRRLPTLMPRSPLLAGAALDALGNPELVLDPDALHAEASRAARTAVSAARPLPILVIDDSLTTRMLEQSILESAGYRVGLATSAEEGLEKARRDSYGLFLVDVEMPGMDGFSFVELTQKDAELRHIPAVLVSSRDAPEDFARGKAAGARGYVVKGRFDQRELLSLIGKLLGRS
jgi:two-component system chemotaxis sensor kinase CheA